jgi:hypothetical protein
MSTMIRAFFVVSHAVALAYYYGSKAAGGGYGD